MALPKGAGALNQRISISRFKKTRDSLGGFSQIEEPVGSCFAQVNVVQAKDNVIADQQRDLRTHEIIIRAGTIEVKQGDIVSWYGINLDVRTTRPVAHWLILDCVTRTV